MPNYVPDVRHFGECVTENLTLSQNRRSASTTDSSQKSRLSFPVDVGEGRVLARANVNTTATSHTLRGISSNAPINVEDKLIVPEYPKGIIPVYDSTLGNTLYNQGWTAFAGDATEANVSYTDDGWTRWYGTGGNQRISTPIGSYPGSTGYQQSRIRLRDAGCQPNTVWGGFEFRYPLSNTSAWQKLVTAQVLFDGADGEIRIGTDLILSIPNYVAGLTEIEVLVELDMETPFEVSKYPGNGYIMEGWLKYWWRDATGLDYSNRDIQGFQLLQMTRPFQAGAWPAFSLGNLGPNVQNIGYDVLFIEHYVGSVQWRNIGAGDYGTNRRYWLIELELDSPGGEINSISIESDSPAPNVADINSAKAIGNDAISFVTEEVVGAEAYYFELKDAETNNVIDIKSSFSNGTLFTKVPSGNYYGEVWTISDSGVPSTGSVVSDIISVPYQTPSVSLNASNIPVYPGENFTIDYSKTDGVIVTFNNSELNDPSGTIVAGVAGSGVEITPPNAPTTFSIVTAPNRPTYIGIL